MVCNKMEIHWNNGDKWVLKDCEDKLIDEAVKCFKNMKKTYFSWIIDRELVRINTSQIRMIRFVEDDK